MPLIKVLLQSRKPPDGQRRRYVCMMHHLSVAIAFRSMRCIYTQVVPLDPEDGSAVVITVARYQTPSGRDINKVGITPDLPLSSDQLPLDKVCSAIAASDAPRLLR